MRTYHRKEPPGAQTLSEPTGRYPERDAVRRSAGALTGVLVAAAAVGVGHLAAAFVAGPASPMIAIGQAVVDGSPEWLKSFAIRTFGSNDKTALLVGIAIVLAAAAAVIGLGATRRRWFGYAGIVCLGLIGMAAA